MRGTMRPTTGMTRARLGALQRGEGKEQFPVGFPLFRPGRGLTEWEQSPQRPKAQRGREGDFGLEPVEGG